MINRIQVQLEKYRLELDLQKNINENVKRALSILGNIENTFFANIQDYNRKKFNEVISSDGSQNIQDNLNLQMENQNLKKMMTNLNDKIIEREKGINNIISEIQKIINL